MVIHKLHVPSGATRSCSKRQLHWCLIPASPTSVFPSVPKPAQPFIPYPSPSKNSGEIVASAQGQHSHGRPDPLVLPLGHGSPVHDLVQYGEDPSSRPISTTHQDAQVGYVDEHFQAARNVHDIGREVVGVWRGKRGV